MSRYTRVYLKKSCKYPRIPGFCDATMPEFPIGTCSNCEQDNRLLKYARRTMCWSYACQQAAHADVAARKALREATGERKEKAAPVFCYKILKVHGQRDFDPAQLVGAKRRNQHVDKESNISYLVYGDFGENERDAGFKDTRWVELTDLMNLSNSELKKLDKYEKELAKRMVAKRQQFIDAAEDA